MLPGIRLEVTLLSGRGVALTAAADRVTVGQLKRWAEKQLAVGIAQLIYEVRVWFSRMGFKIRGNLICCWVSWGLVLKILFTTFDSMPASSVKNWRNLYTDRIHLMQGTRNLPPFFAHLLSGQDSLGCQFVGEGVVERWRSFDCQHSGCADFGWQDLSSFLPGARRWPCGCMG